MTLTPNQRRLTALGEAIAFPGRDKGKAPEWRRGLARLIGVPQTTLLSWMRVGHDVPDERLAQAETAIKSHIRKALKVVEKRT